MMPELVDEFFLAGNLEVVFVIQLFEDLAL